MISRDEPYEAELVARVQALAPWFPQGTATQRDRADPPDVEVATPGGRLGVEVTQVIEAGSKELPARRELRSLHVRAVNLACARYAALGLPPVHVQAFFEPDERLDRAADLAERLAEFVAAAVRRGVECESYGPLEVPRGLRVVHVTVGGPLAWIARSGGGMPAFTMNDISAALDRKERKLTAYRREFDRVWLLLWTSSSYAGGVMAVPRDFDRWTFSSDFDGIALYDGQSSRVRRVALR